MADNPFTTQSPGLIGPYKSVAAVTPNDSTDLPNGVCRGLYIGVAGNLSFIDASGNVIAAQPVQAGIFPVGVQRVKASGTTATGILAGY